MDVQLQSSKLLSPAEEKAIDQTVKELKDIRDEVELTQGVNFEAKNKQEIQKKINELEGMLKTHGMPELSDKDRLRALNEIKLLEEDLKKDAPDWDTYVSLTPKDGPRYVALVNKLVQWQKSPVRAQKVQRWRTLRRLVDPTDPQAGNTMHLFPQ